MAVDAKPKRLFKVASEFNVSTQSIVDALGKNGFTIDNKPNSKITQEMYEVLERNYGEDKARSREHERSREEYETRRTAILSSRNEKVTLNSLDSIDSLDPLEPLDSLEPQDTISEQPAPKPTDVQEQPEKAEPPKAPEPPKVEKQEVVVEPVKPEPVRPEVETTPDKDDKKPEPVEKTETAEADKPSDPEPIEEEGKTVTAAKPPAPEPEPTPPAAVDDEPEEVIRGRAQRLKGTRVIGRIDVAQTVPEDAEEPLKKRKKKKKKVVSAKTDDPVKKAETTEDDGASKSRKKKKRITGKPEKKVSSEDVDTKMRETMALLQGGSGKKRQKRRRAKRDEAAAERELMEEMSKEQGSILEVSEFITVSDLADLMNVTVNQVITACMSNGMFVSINQRLDAASIELIAVEFDREVKFIDAEQMSAELVEEEDDPDTLEQRAPVVTVMGHVDHGKTSLLDYIRKTRVTAGEAGGITQHIGAYAVSLSDGRKITFLDTPGHEAFTAMRARGAQATDIVILVVAADDRVMPQTIEAINHAQAGGVPIVVAINKMDKPEANPDKIRQQLSDHNVIVEDWGGKTQVAEVSAHSGAGIDSLLEKVLIEAELMELKANPNRKASGIILETKVDKGKGVVANVLVQKGSMKVGDPFVAGQYYGRVRLMENEHAEKLTDAGPSTPIQLTGFDGLPQAGDKIVVTVDEKTAKEIAIERQQIKRQQDLRKVKHLTLDDIARRLALGDIAELNLIIKGDVDGSIEALSGSLQKISNDEVQVHVIHTGVGAISESDVLLASASDAIIIGFQVRPTSNARKLAEKEQIDIRLFSVIYDAVDAVKDALEGMLSPEIGEKITSNVEVRETFKVPGAGTIAGCYVTEGKITRNTKIRLIRDGIVIFDGTLSSLKRFKDDVREVSSGYECGMGINNYNDIKVGDIIEGYEITETKRKLSQ
ncbi:MAG: translation initiation factor IF-2 [Bacteroidetes bacterium]|nr:translation initiation factor IF-2 [Bacteroidota bacterium]MCH8522968.1 translation initiation factor IF-2 [Balneolales bacterium]